jgi:hypothetical protein
LAVASARIHGIFAFLALKGGCRGEQGAEAVESGSQEAQTEKERL